MAGQCRARAETYQRTDNRATARIVPMSDTRHLSHRLTWAYSQELPAPEGAVLVRLTFVADKDSLECWPSLSTIADATGLGVSTVRRCIRSLEAAGLIASLNRPGTSRRYRLAIPPGEEAPRPERAPTPPTTGDPPPGAGAHPARSGRVSGNDPVNSGQGTGEGARKRATRATRLPDDWQPSKADIDFARTEGFDDGLIQRTADQFRDHWLAQPGANGRKLDWPATWRKWVRKDADDARRRAQGATDSGGRKATTQGDRQRAMAGSLRDAVDRRRRPPTAAGGRGDTPPALAAATIIDG